MLFIGSAVRGDCGRARLQPGLRAPGRFCAPLHRRCCALIPPPCFTLCVWGLCLSCGLHAMGVKHAWQVFVVLGWQQLCKAKRAWLLGGRQPQVACRCDAVLRCNAGAHVTDVRMTTRFKDDDLTEARSLAFQSEVPYA